MKQLNSIDCSFQYLNSQLQLKEQCEFYRKLFNRCNMMIQNNNLHQYDIKSCNKPSFQNQKLLVYSIKNMQNLQTIKRVILSHFSTVTKKNQKVITKINNIRFIEAKAKDNNNLRVRIVKNMIYKSSQDEGEQRFVIVHFFTKNSLVKRESIQQNDLSNQINQIGQNKISYSFPSFQNSQSNSLIKCDNNTQKAGLRRSPRINNNSQIIINNIVNKTNEKLQELIINQVLNDNFKNKENLPPIKDEGQDEERMKLQTEIYQKEQNLYKALNQIRKEQEEKFQQLEQLKKELMNLQDQI